MSTETPPPGSHIDPVNIEDEMKRSYLDYAMSVIVSRALPDVRDGLKPVQRRILYAMKVGGYEWNRQYRKSARIVGDVMGKYHPHGDSAIYDAMVRMAQPFSLRLPLIDGQGNFGSMDGDPPAAMRYTEARMARAADSLIDDIDKDTVDFAANYDDTDEEPTVIPARFPNLLVNGAGGIAVGMATNIPPHNLGEVIDACCAYVDNPNVTTAEIMELVPGPDFPTGGIILGKQGIQAAYEFGRGSIVMRAKTHFEEIRKDRQAIIVTEIPYQENKSRLIERIAEVARDGKVEGISDLRDESDRDGVRVVIELKRDVMGEVVLNQLFRFTPLQTSFGVNSLSLHGGRPQMLNLREMIEAFVQFREEVITRRTVFELKRARERAHVLIGLAVAVANVDDVVAAIRHAKDPAEARETLMTTPWPAGDVAPLIELVAEPGRQVGEDGMYMLSEAQARAILELRLQRLTGLERDKIGKELEEIVEQIREYLEILATRERLHEVLRDELVEMKEMYATPRRTELLEDEFETDIEDLIQPEDMVVTVSHSGYIKRVPLSAFRAQRRGGKGRSGMATRDDDFVTQVFVLNTHTPVLFFSSRGMVYKLKVYKLPQGSPTSRGKAMVNLLPLQEGETITTMMPMPEDEETWGDWFVMFATASGNVRRNSLKDFVRVQSNGKIAMKLDEGDRLVSVQTANEDQDVLLATRSGRCIRFPVEKVRVFAGRNSTGVRGIKLAEGDEVISMTLLRHAEFDSVEERDAYLKLSRLRRADEDAEAEDSGETPALSDERYEEMAANEQFLLSVTAKGFGKRTSAYEDRVTGRGGQGVTNMDLGKKVKPDENWVAAVFPVADGDQIMLVTNSGQTIRCPVADIRIAGRATRGVTIFRIGDEEHVVSVAHMDEGDEEDEEAGEVAAAEPAPAARESDEADDAAGEETGDDPGEEPGDDAET